MDLDELIAQVDIVEYISQFVDLKQQGDEWWGLCPFHNEKSPSFSVSQVKQMYYCFGCGEGGNVFTFIREYNKCSPQKAIEIIKKYVGYDKELKGVKMAATMVCKRYMRRKSPDKHSSGVVLPSDYMKRYEKREDKLAVWENEGISKASLDKYEIYYDRFSDRLVYPIRDMNGEIVNVGGRTLDPDWKNKKLRKYTYFYSWGEMNTIYGIYENMNAIKKQQEVILFEGCKSVLIADTWEIRNTGALLTSHLSDTQMKLLAKLGVRVVFALDKGICVRNDKKIKTLKNYVNVDYIWDKDNLLEDKDSPVDKGVSVFNQLYKEREYFS